MSIFCNRNKDTVTCMNPKIIKELTAAVFATEAPRWTDFFPADSLDIEAAKGCRFATL